MKKLVYLFCIYFSFLNSNSLLMHYTPLFAYCYTQRIFLDSDTLYYLLKNQSNTKVSEEKIQSNLELRKIHDFYDSLSTLFFTTSAACYYYGDMNGFLVNGSNFQCNVENLYYLSIIMAYLIFIVKTSHLIVKDSKWLKSCKLIHN